MSQQGRLRHRPRPPAAAAVVAAPSCWAGWRCCCPLPPPAAPAPNNKKKQQQRTAPVPRAAPRPAAGRRAAGRRRRARSSQHCTTPQCCAPLSSSLPSSSQHRPQSVVADESDASSRAPLALLLRQRIPPHRRGDRPHHPAGLLLLLCVAAPLRACALLSSFAPPLLTPHADGIGWSPPSGSCSVCGKASSRSPDADAAPPRGSSNSFATICDAQQEAERMQGSGGIISARRVRCAGRYDARHTKTTSRCAQKSLMLMHETADSSVCAVVAARLQEVRCGYDAQRAVVGVHDPHVVHRVAVEAVEDLRGGDDENSSGRNR